MKFTEKTLSVLKNFSTINNGLMIKKGNVQRTVALTKDVLAEAHLDQSFPRDFAIYDLNGFLSMLSTFNGDGDAEIDFQENHMVITSGRRKLKYYYASPTVIFSPPDDLKLDSPTQRFDLVLDDLKLIQKMASFDMGDLTIKSDGDKIYISVINGQNNNSNEMNIEVDQSMDTCEVTFDVGLMKVIPQKYSVGVNDKSVHFKNENDDVQYWIVLRN
jgi:hypothetical protein